MTVAAVVVVLALAGTTAANAANAPLNPDVVCAYCDGSGPPQGCATVVSAGGDGYGDVAYAYYNWCWYNGSVTWGYGWSDESPGSVFNTFTGFTANQDIPGPGHLTIAHFDAVSFSIGVKIHVDRSARACVQVNGWGQSWGC